MSDSTEEGKEFQRIYSKGIYHGLPDLSHAPNGLTAIVTGANGISGAHMVHSRIHNLPFSTPPRRRLCYAVLD